MSVRRFFQELYAMGICVDSFIEIVKDEDASDYLIEKIKLANSMDELTDVICEFV